MNFRKLGIIFSIILIIFANSSNASFALSSEPSKPVINEYIKSLEIIDNSMYILIKSIASENINKNEINKNIKFIETLISDLTLTTSKLAEKDNDAILAMQIILNYYKISIINIKNYIESNNADNLIDAITSFSIGYDSSSSLRSIIGKVR